MAGRQDGARRETDGGDGSRRLEERPSGESGPDVAADDVAVATADHQRPAARVVDHAGDGAGVSGQRAQLADQLPLEGPESDGAVGRPGGEVAAVRSEG